MRQKATRAVLWIGAVALCALPSIGQAQDTGGATASGEMVGWGKPQDGLQVGLFLATPQREFHPGETLSFTLRVRNVGPKPVAYAVKGSDPTLLSLGAGHRLRLQTGMGPAVPLRLAPGAETVLPGGTFQVRIQSPGADNVTPAQAATIPAQTAVALLPGRYILECPSPLWIADKEDANRATGHRAKAGVLTFTVASVREGPTTMPASPAAPQDIQWGEVVNGLQGGISSGPSADPGRELPLTFSLRNTTNQPLALRSPNWQEYDWSPIVLDAQGKSRTVACTFLSGMRGTAKRVIQPGEIVALGHTRMRLAREAPAGGDQSPLPTLTAAPGRYTVSLVGSVRYEGMDSFDVVLVSGALAFEIAQP